MIDNEQEQAAKEIMNLILAIKGKEFDTLMDDNVERSTYSMETSTIAFEYECLDVGNVPRVWRHEAWCSLSEDEDYNGSIVLVVIEGEPNIEHFKVYSDLDFKQFLMRLKMVL
ncbi:hypothetical protein V5T82_14155 [Magnetovibrio sp. PR-2]|uniref:hypothetical protein n=1 Tax=Magnetovibrio sp. PR-2 TaxID=3120356 RepID=UPI002FCE1B00